MTQATASPSSPTSPIVDVLIIGAGLSGVGMACHLKRECPDKSLLILERRKTIGGTWDLFRYPGIRSDSDMFTFGFKFRPWNELKVLADGPSIRQYVNDTAREYGIDRMIRFGLKTTRMEWSDAQRLWTVTALDEASGQTQQYRARYLVGATGYYNYDRGYEPAFPGRERFQGQVIHPQHWPESLDYRGKRVVVIGSGATAVTLVPAMADQAASVTMLQRSPSYVFSVPGYDQLSAVLLKLLPRQWVFSLARKRNIVVQRWIYLASQRWPAQVRRWLLSGVRRQLGPNADMSHFTPRYNPWEERLCAVPDADLFKAIRSGKARVVTDQIETFTETGIQLKSGAVLDADIIVTATGLQVQMLGGAELVVGGKPQPLNQLMTYKSVLVQDVPNMAVIFGYTNAPWTLKADLASEYICRLLKHMDSRGLAVATPRPHGEQPGEETIFGALGSGYVKRAQAVLPKQGHDVPWRVLHHFERDTAMLRDEPIEDGLLEFEPARTGSATAARMAA